MQSRPLNDIKEDQEITRRMMAIQAHPGPILMIALRALFGQLLSGNSSLFFFTLPRKLSGMIV
jgi:hypothetical protein